MASSFQKFCLRWNNHATNLLSTLGHVLSSEHHSDVTLCCQGEVWKLHKLVLCASSRHFEDLLGSLPASQSPILILDGPSAQDVALLVQFIYHGEVNVDQENLASLLRTAESLKIKGLAEVSSVSGALENRWAQEQEARPLNLSSGRNRLDDLIYAATERNKKEERRKDVEPPVPKRPRIITPPGYPVGSPEDLSTDSVKEEEEEEEDENPSPVNLSRTSSPTELVHKNLNPVNVGTQFSPSMSSVEGPGSAQETGEEKPSTTPYIHSLMKQVNEESAEPGGNAQRVTVNMRTFKEEWRRQLLVDYDSRTNMSICMLCFTTFKSYDGPRKNTYVKHAKRFHPSLEEYSEQERDHIINMYGKYHKYDVDMQKEVNKSFRTSSVCGSGSSRKTTPVHESPPVLLNGVVKDDLETAVKVAWPANSASSVASQDSPETSTDYECRRLATDEKGIENNNVVFFTSVKLNCHSPKIRMSEATNSAS